MDTRRSSRASRRSGKRWRSWTTRHREGARRRDHPEGRPYFAMEYVGRGDHDLLRPRTAFRSASGSSCSSSSARACSTRTRKGIIHRDLKPSNILVTLQDDRRCPSHRLRGGQGDRAAAHRATLFTEVGDADRHARVHEPRAGGERPRHRHPTDVYSLGVILYELCRRAAVRPAGLRAAGFDEHPANDSRGRAAAAEHARDRRWGARPEARRRIGPIAGSAQLRGDLDWIVLKALEKDRTRRYQTASALAQDIRRPLNTSRSSLARRVSATGSEVRAPAPGGGRRGGAGRAPPGIRGVWRSGLAASRTARPREPRGGDDEKSLDFLVGLFHVSDPSEARGHTITAREILAEWSPSGWTRACATSRTCRRGWPPPSGAVYTNLGMYTRGRGRCCSVPFKTRGGHWATTTPSTLRTAQTSWPTCIWYRGEVCKSAEPALRRSSRSGGAPDCWVTTTPTHSGPASIWPASYAQFRNGGPTPSASAANDAGDSAAALGPPASRYRCCRWGTFNLLSFESTALPRSRKDCRHRA